MHCVLVVLFASTFFTGMPLLPACLYCTFSFFVIKCQLHPIVEFIKLPICLLLSVDFPSVPSYVSWPGLFILWPAPEPSLTSTPVRLRLGFWWVPFYGPRAFAVSLPLRLLFCYTGCSLCVPPWVSPYVPRAFPCVPAWANPCVLCPFSCALPGPFDRFFPPTLFPITF